MALTTALGRNSITTDVVLASASSITAFSGSSPVFTIHNVTLAPISTATGDQCGHITIRDGAVVLMRFYVFFTATAASQGNSETFEVNATFSPATSVNVLYTAVTDATTAAVSIVWSRG